jgi:hypothetical protein
MELNDILKTENIDIEQLQKGLKHLGLKAKQRSTTITSRIFSKREANMPLLSFDYWVRLNTKPKWKRLLMVTEKSE